MPGFHRSRDGAAEVSELLDRAVAATVACSPDVRRGREGLLRALENPYAGGMGASHFCYYLARDLLVWIGRRSHALRRAWVWGRVPAGAAAGLSDLSLLLQPVPGREQALKSAWREARALLLPAYGALVGLGADQTEALLSTPESDLFVSEEEIEFGVPRRFDPLIPLFQYFTAFPPRIKQQFDIKRRLRLRGLTQDGLFETEVSAVERSARTRFYEYRAGYCDGPGAEALRRVVRDASFLSHAERERYLELMDSLKPAILISSDRVGSARAPAALALLGRSGDQLVIHMVSRLNRVNVLSFFKYIHSVLAAAIPEAVREADPERRVLVDRSENPAFRRLAARVRKGMLYQSGDALVRPEFTLLELLYIHTEKYPTITAWLKFFWEDVSSLRLPERAAEEVVYNHSLSDAMPLLLEHFQEEFYEESELEEVRRKVDAVAALEPAAAPLRLLLARKDRLPRRPPLDRRPVRVFGLLNGVNLLHELVAAETAGGRTLRIRITGPPGTSKTTLAQLIRRHGIGGLEGGEVAVLHFDDYAEQGEAYLDRARARLQDDPNVRLVIVESFYSRLYFARAACQAGLEVLMRADDALRQNRVKRRDSDVMKRVIGDQHFQTYATQLDGKDLLIDTSKDFDLDDVSERLEALGRRSRRR